MVGGFVQGSDIREDGSEVGFLRITGLDVQRHNGKGATVGIWRPAEWPVLNIIRPKLFLAKSIKRV